MVVIICVLFVGPKLNPELNATCVAMVVIICVLFLDDTRQAFVLHASYALPDRLHPLFGVYFRV
jgi:hypothetical protein